MRGRRNCAQVPQNLRVDRGRVASGADAPDRDHVVETAELRIELLRQRFELEVFHFFLDLRQQLVHALEVGVRRAIRAKGCRPAR